MRFVTIIIALTLSASAQVYSPNNDKIDNQPATNDVDNTVIVRQKEPPH